jgi:hypothetical protein
MTKNQKKLHKLLSEINTKNYFDYVAYYDYLGEYKYENFGITPLSQDTYLDDFEQNKRHIAFSCIILYKRTKRGLKKIWQISQKDTE